MLSGRASRKLFLGDQHDAAKCLISANSFSNTNTAALCGTRYSGCTARRRITQRLGNSECRLDNFRNSVRGTLRGRIAIGCDRRGAICGCDTLPCAVCIARGDGNTHCIRSTKAGCRSSSVLYGLTRGRSDADASSSGLGRGVNVRADRSGGTDTRGITNAGANRATNRGVRTSTRGLTNASRGRGADRCGGTDTRSRASRSPISPTYARRATRTCRRTRGRR